MNSEDVAREWQAAVERVRDLAQAAGDQGMARHVPATPDWRVRDLLAHMIGLDADVLAGDEPDDHNPAWTQAHVDARRDADVGALLAEWRGLEPAMVAYMRDTDPRPIGDVVIHEQDLRGALGVPGARDTEGLATVRATMAHRLGKAVEEAELAPVRMEAPDWQWRSGDGEPGLTLRASGFDLFRAVTSRRTADQLRAYAVDGDVDPYLTVFAGLGSLPETPLPE